jgi:2-oxo-4-hydroxy-4-carboxy--5-ureidoimidazoline (OHCU) decarboxylase
MRELWTAQVHLLTPPAEFGDTKCFTNVAAWAEDAEDFTATITSIFDHRQWSILNVLKCMRAVDRPPIADELTEQIEEAKLKPEVCIFGTLHYYPSKPA